MNEPKFNLHSFSVYDLDLRMIHSNTDENLFRVIRSKKRYIVDSSVEWQSPSLKLPDIAFILGETIQCERDNPQGEFFNAKVEGGRENVFIFNHEIGPTGPVLAIHRLDDHYAAIFKMPIPRLSEETEEQKKQWNCPDKRRAIRDHVAQLYQQPPRQLRECIDVLLQYCVGNIHTCIDVAEHSYALYLVEKGSKEPREMRKFENNDPNLFGDTGLIRDALFFEANVFSRDHHVKKMCSYLSIKCEDIGNT